MSFRQYSYKQKKWVGPACAIFFGACAWTFLEKAREQPRGLIINHMIELSPSSAQVFHWTLFGFSMLFVVTGIAAFVLSFGKEKYITITAHSIRAPKNGFSDIEIEVPFADIKSMQLQEIQKQRFLHITHANGKLSIVQSLLPSKAAFEEICALITAKVQK